MRALNRVSKSARAKTVFGHLKGERAGARGLWDPPRPSSFFPRSPAARRTDPLNEGLEQATLEAEITNPSLIAVHLFLFISVAPGFYQPHFIANNLVSISDPLEIKC